MRAEFREAEFILPERAPSAVTRRWFVAGDAWLAIDVPSRRRTKAPQALHDAVLLGDRDALLRRLAEGCGEDFAWRPADAEPAAAGDADRTDAAPNATRSRPTRAGAARPSAARPDAARPSAARPDAARPNAARPLDVTLGDVDDAQTRIAVALPDALRERLLSATFADADAPRVVAHRPERRLELDRFALAPDDAARCGAGALVLMPGSFAPRWRVAFGAPETGGTMPLALSLDVASGAMRPERTAGGGDAPAAGAGAESTGDAADGPSDDAPVADAADPAGPTPTAPTVSGDDGVRCTVTLERTWTVPLERWSGGGADGTPLPIDLASGAKVSVRLDGGADALFAGELVTLGRGFGVLLDTAP